VWTVKGCETGPTVYSPYPRRHESLTICGCNYKGSTFSSVILRPRVLVWQETNSRPPAWQSDAQPTEPPVHRKSNTKNNLKYNYRQTKHTSKPLKQELLYSKINLLAKGLKRIWQLGHKQRKQQLLCNFIIFARQMHLQYILLRNENKPPPFHVKSTLPIQHSDPLETYLERTKSEPAERVICT